jgi:ferredoxin
MSDEAGDGVRISGRTLRIDHDLCSGTTHCVEIAPGAFTIRDGRSWPTEQLSDGQSADPELVTRAVEACPWFAISYTDDEETA